MADICISYTRKDKLWAEELADFLRENGFSVSHDSEHSHINHIQDKQQKQSCNATAVIVIWSARSVKSSFFVSQALQAKQQKRLLSTYVDGFSPEKIPKQFTSTQSQKLSGISDIVRSLSSMGIHSTHKPSSYMLKVFEERILSFRHKRKCRAGIATFLFLLAVSLITALTFYAIRENYVDVGHWLAWFKSFI